LKYSSKNNFIGVIAHATIAGYLLKGLSFIVSMVTIPIVIANLGKVEYGILVLIGQTVSLLAMSDIGIQTSIGRFVAKYRVLDNFLKLRILQNTSLFLLSLVSLIIAIISISIVNWIPSWLNIDPQYHDIAKVIFIINSFMLAVLFPSRIGQGMIAGFQLYRSLYIIKMLSPILRLTGILSLSKMNQLGLLELTILIAASMLIEQFIIIVYANHLSRISPVGLKYFSFKMAREILSLGTSSFFISTSGILLGQGITISVGTLLNTAAAGVYGVVIMIMTNISFILTKMGQPLVTISSELDIKKRISELRDVSNIVMSISFIISGILSVFLFFYTQPLLVMLLSDNWSQSDYTAASKSIIIMSVSMTIGVPQFVSRAVLQGVGLHWEASIAKITSSIISFVVAIVLLSLGYGIVGAAIGWGMAWVLQGVIYIPNLIVKYLEQSWSQLFLRSYLPGIVLIVVNSLIGSLFMYFIDTNIYSILVSGMIMLAISISIFIIFTNHYYKNSKINFRSLINLVKVK